MGDTLTYTITATNTGDANLTNVFVSDDLITPTGGTAPCGLVLPGDTCTLVGTYAVIPADITAGSILNTATADSDQTPPVTDVSHDARPVTRSRDRQAGAGPTPTRTVRATCRSVTR